MKKPILITIGVFTIIVLIVSYTLKEPVFRKLKDQIEFELRTNHPEKADACYLKVIREDTFDIANHYNYIQNHYNIPVSYKVGRYSYENRNDSTIANFYCHFINSQNVKLRDLGHYAKGLIQVNEGNYAAALKEYRQVQDTLLPYYNNSLGYVYLRLDLYNEAERHFKREIALNGNVDGAYSNLINLLHQSGRATELNLLLADQKMMKYFSLGERREFYFSNFKMGGYFQTLGERILNHLNLFGFLAALLITLCWVIFLRKIDIYEPETWVYVLLTVGLGMAFSFLTFPLSDIDHVFFGFSLNGKFWNDFLYCVGGIGAVEELAKIIPLLLMLRFTKEVNEPYDYILYASLSALGFAFMENLIYFDETSLQIIHGRALTAVVSHMFDSSIIAYGLILNHYRYHKNPVLIFLLFWGLASLAHGFYDFWLVSESVKGLGILTIALLLVSMYMWNSFKNNALNNSVFFDKQKVLDNKKLQEYLIYFLAGVMLFEYLAIAIKYSPQVANDELFSSFQLGSYLIFFISGSLSNFRIREGQWAPIRLWSDSAKTKLEAIIDHAISVKAFSSNSYLDDILPNEGKIVKRLVISREPNWYLVQLEKPHTQENFNSHYILLRAKVKREALEAGKIRLAALFIIPEVTDLEKHGLTNMDFRFCGWVYVAVK